MPFEAFSFDDSVGRTEAARARVPEGFYLVECEGLEPTAEDYKNTTGVWCKVRIVAGPDASPSTGVGGRMRDFNAVGKTDAQFGLGQMLAAFGQEAVAKQLANSKLQIPNYAAFQNLVTNLNSRVQGKRAVAFIADQQGTNGRSFSGIDELHPEADWANYRTVGLGGGGSANGASRPSGPAPANPGGAAEAIDSLFSDLER